jgi:hypothetical protein
VGVFLLTFFNTALAILLINARFDKTPSNHLLFNGIYTDFSDDWYDQSSEYFVTPMFMELSTPFLLFFIDFAYQKATALVDRRFTDPKLYKTQCNIAYEYAEINSGTSIVLSDKYSWMLTIVMVGMFYGFGLPLIPITVFVCLICTFTIDKAAAIFYHRKPPLYDFTLNKDSVIFLKWGAFLYVSIAYWMLTNKQMFNNVIDPIEYKDQIENYHHHIFEIPDKIQQKILLFYALLLFIFLFFNDIILRFILEFLKSHDEEEYSKDVEEPSPFSQSLKRRDFDLIIEEERERREVFGYR